MTEVVHFDGFAITFSSEPSPDPEVVKRLASWRLGHMRASELWMSLLTSRQRRDWRYHQEVQQSGRRYTWRILPAGSSNLRLRRKGSRMAWDFACLVLPWTHAEASGYDQLITQLMLIRSDEDYLLQMLGYG